MSSTSHPPALQLQAPPLAPYVLIEPFVRDRGVLELGPRHPEGGERLLLAGAASFRTLDVAEPPTELPDASFDVVVCLGALAGCSDDVQRHRWLAEVRRLVRPTGFAVVRVPVALVDEVAPRARAAFQDLMRHHFSTVALVNEAPVAALSFALPGIEDVAVNEALGPVAGEPTQLVGFATPAAEPAWELVESLLVPSAPSEALERRDTVAALAAEVERLRRRLETVASEQGQLNERLMTMQDELDRRDQALLNLRREADRRVAQVAETGAAVELVALERERAERRAADAERLVATLQADLRERDARLGALTRVVPDLPD